MRITDQGERCEHIKRITSRIFLNIYTPPQHALTPIILFLLKELIKLTLNVHQNNLTLTLSLYLVSTLFCQSLCFFAFFFIYYFHKPLTIIIGIFYCLNYTSLLPYLIAKPFYHTFLMDLLFSLSLPVTIRIFSCLNYTSSHYNRPCKYVLQ